MLNYRTKYGIQAQQDSKYKLEQKVWYYHAPMIGDKLATKWLDWGIIKAVKFKSYLIELSCGKMITAHEKFLKAKPCEE
ncbi:hypothetical protein GVAV_000398 [Gurleya vavrai]